MFGEYRSKSTGPGSKPIPSKRPPWHRRVFLCPGRSKNQSRGALLVSPPSDRLSTSIEHCNRNRGSGPAICPINRYPPRLRCWLRARPRKVREKVPPVSSASYGTYSTFHCLSRTSHEYLFCMRAHSGLLFTCRALENMQADQASELRACFQRSYDDVLRHHHGWFIQTAVCVRVGNAL
jgi:hypothetical protein